MSHPDEGTIQMLLDGELEPRERARIESHAAGCSACQARIAEARGYQLEADRLVDVLAVPSRTAPPRTTGRRRRAIGVLAWAASVAIAVGIGFFGRGQTAPQPVVVADRHDTPSSTPEPGTKTTVAPDAPVPATRAPALADGRQSARPETKQVPSVAPPAAASAPPATGIAATRDERATQDAATEPSAANAMQAKVTSMEAEGVRNEPTGGWRVIALEEAVRILDGQIRLIDGLAPERVESGPGTAVAGADPTAAVVRVVYASGTIILDEQRVGQPAAGGRLEAARPAQAAGVGSMAGWREAGAIRFAVTGSVSADSLGALSARVR